MELTLLGIALVAYLLAAGGFGLYLLISRPAVAALGPLLLLAALLKGQYV